MYYSDRRIKMDEQNKQFLKDKIIEIRNNKNHKFRAQVKDRNNLKIFLLRLLSTQENNETFINFFTELTQDLEM